MKWKKVSVYVNALAEDTVSAMLMELGVSGVEIFYPDDFTVALSFYLREYESSAENGQKVVTEGIVDNSYAITDRMYSDEEYSLLMEAVKKGLSELSEYSDIGESRIEEGELTGTDWLDTWKNYVEPVVCGDILIVPEGACIPPELAEMTASGELKPVYMDSGTVFGSGSHETTRLCIAALKEHTAPESSILDIGAGSGILSIAAFKYGAGFAALVDIDPACEEVIGKNAVLNGIDPGSIYAVTGNVLSDDGTAEKILLRHQAFDIVCANVLTPVIKALACENACARFVKKGGHFIASGILNTYEEEVTGILTQNPLWGNLRISRMGEWVCITAERM